MAKKSAKKGGATKAVHVGVKSLEKLQKAARKAGLAKDFKDAVGKTKKAVFVQIDHKNFGKLKKLVQHEKLAAHPTAKSLSDCDCDPQDPFCFCI